MKNLITVFSLIVAVAAVAVAMNLTGSSNDQSNEAAEINPVANTEAESKVASIESVATGKAVEVSTSAKAEVAQMATVSQEMTKKIAQPIAGNADTDVVATTTSPSGTTGARDSGQASGAAGAGAGAAPGAGGAGAGAGAAGAAGGGAAAGGAGVGAGVGAAAVGGGAVVAGGVGAGIAAADDDDPATGG